jgi:hypothetical protein
MVRKFVTLVFAGMFVMMAVLGIAPSTGEDTRAARAPVAVQQPSLQYPAMRDEASMVLVGTALIALAAALRRAA